MQVLAQRKIFAVFLTAMLMLPLCSFAQEQSQLQLSEQKIKAGLIYNFLKYTEWPAARFITPSSPITICIFGAEDPFNGYLQPIEDRTVNQRPVKLRHVSRAEDTVTCHMLFIGSDDQAQWPVLRKALDNKSVLTVGDFTGFTQAGGMIEFNTEENRIQIGLNLEAVGAARLRIYDNLRRLAKTTQTPSSGGAK
jgi:hypothetical protein